MLLARTAREVVAVVAVVVQMMHNAMRITSNKSNLRLTDGLKRRELQSWKRDMRNARHNLTCSTSNPSNR